MASPTESKKMTKWFQSTYKYSEDMIAINHKITAVVCLLDNYVTVVEDVKMLRDSSESHHIFWATLD